MCRCIYNKSEHDIFVVQVDIPMLPTKFVNLKHLCIQIISSTLSPDYDYFSLISLLDASPSLETWRLEVRCYPSYISSKLIYVATNLGAFIDSISWFYIVLGF